MYTIKYSYMISEKVRCFRERIPQTKYKNTMKLMHVQKRYLQSYYYSIINTYSYKRTYIFTLNIN